MATCYFVYAGDPHNGEVRSPFTITRNLYNALSKLMPTKYFDWTQTDTIITQPDDIFIGHPNADPNTVTHKFFNSNQQCKLKCLIHPLHTNRVEDNWPFNHLAMKADHIFSIAGPYWIDTIDKTQFAHWKPKIIRLDMAVDANHFKYVKNSFNNIGSRRLLYIGSSIPNKNLDYMYKIMQRLSQTELYWYGADGHKLGKLPNVKCFGHTHISQEVAIDIASKCDIFISTSNSDANPTTILETAAIGIVPIVTKESGYWPNATNGQLQTFGIDLDNLNNSIHNIKRLLVANSDYMFNVSKHNRELIISNYNWDIFCEKVISALKSRI